MTRGLISERSLVRLAAIATVVAAWMLSRPYGGVVHDACLYIGRALADLDPQGIGRDLAFTHDQQSGFSLFSPLVAAAVRALGAGGAGMALAALGLAAWLAAAAFLASRFAKGALLWAALISLAALPQAYGGHGVFQWAEPFATPRIFAEAAGLAGLAWLVDGRRIAAALALALSAALHPLMAAAPLGVAFLWLAAQDRRWWALAGLAVLGLLGAALIGAPIAERLFQALDPDWQAVLVQRTPYLFPKLWPNEAWALFICQLAVLGLAARAVEARLRPLITGAVVAALAGVLIAVAVPSLLALQLQLWRAQWIAAVLAALLFAPLAAHLWREGPAGRAALASLTLAWLAHDVLLLALAGSAGAVFLVRWGRSRPVSPRLALALWAVTAIVGAVLTFERLWAVEQAFTAMAPGDRLPLSMVLQTGAQGLLAVLAVALALAGLAPRGPRAAAACALAGLALVAAAAGLWDDRTAFIRDRDRGVGAETLRQALGPGQVYWLDGAGLTTLWTGKAQWWSGMQGSGAVLDRELAIAWEARLTALIASGAALPQDRAPLDRDGPRRTLTLTAAALARTCAIPDGPDWIVAPLGRLAPGAARGAALWRPASPEFRIDAAGGARATNRLYAVIGCAKPPSASPARSAPASR